METTRFNRPYDPRGVEERWYRRWEEQGYFHADETLTNSNRFCIVIPPPNITGSLHIGHALNNTLQDILIRWKRMQGYNTLWMPGTDHAGIATQNVVERQLLTEGTSRERLGREAFIRRVWKWREESGRTIITQLKRLGASCDWVRERFTMDEGLSAAVREVFVCLYEDELIYRGERLINWCPRCQTALSDIEVEHEEIKGKLYYIKYPLDFSTLNSQLGQTQGLPLLPTINYLIVATTRPETMLGDTAVAVHPEDPRYKQLIDKKKVRLPLTNRIIPIVGDPTLVDREFGTGAVKITPGHDFNDEKAGQRHGLPKISIFDEKARIKSSLPDVDSEVMGDIQMLEVSKARGRVTDWLERRGQLVKVEDHKHAIGKCYRCKTVVEPYLSAQWFVRVNDPKNSLAAPAIEAVRSGRIRMIPEGWKNNYFGWMENIQDWCISRQIWWGHRIPAWYCKQCNKDILEAGIGVGTVSEGGALPSIEETITTIGVNAKPIVQLEPPQACPDCGSPELIQDSDVLDTWFSSALWPFSTLGWPPEQQYPHDVARQDEAKLLLEKFYPTSVLVTSFDILFFWVARMIMMGLKFMGTIPFHEVYIHALVRDVEGQKMSKSKGNVIDPLIMMDQYGTDALRFTLASMASPGRDLKLSEERLEGYRNFTNKIWNAARFALMNLPKDIKPEGTPVAMPRFSVANVWIQSRLHRTIGSVNKSLESYRFDEAAAILYQFIWHEFCDWYLELIKVDFQEENDDLKQETYKTLTTTFETILRLLHPFMPFMTEEIWTHFPHRGESLTVAPYPQANPNLFNQGVEGIVEEIIIKTVMAIRNLRGEMNISPAEELTILVNSKSENATDLFNRHLPYVKRLTRITIKEVGVGLSKPKMAATVLTPWAEIYIPLNEERIKKDIERLRKALLKVEKDLEPVEKKYNDRHFVTKAPKDVVAKLGLQRTELQEKRYKINTEIQRKQDMLS